MNSAILTISKLVSRQSVNISASLLGVNNLYASDIYIIYEAYQTLFYALRPECNNECAPRHQRLTTRALEKWRNIMH